MRNARQVSHPNVCRVYDIGEVDGQHFLTMEYIDGEDLASLLRRIGRLPADKALETTHQICAGLAAAHDCGLLHRDLKPANIMLDGRGRVRITDFGLALSSDDAQGRSETAGTPAYMAPEQIGKGEASVRSDIYSLGLVLYELFTGRLPYQATTPIEWRRAHLESSPRTPSSVVKDIDPVVEKAILRCLEKDPVKRPASVRLVAAAFPGGDPLAAALAAGETPSPEMVAASGETEGLRPLVAWVLLAGVIVSVTVAILLSAQTKLYRRVPLETPPEELALRARDVLRSTGYSEPPADTAMGFYQGTDFLRYIAEHDKSKTRWDNLETGAFVFWYRGSPRPLSARFFASDAPVPGAVWTDDPPLDTSGMTLVQLNPLGRLTQFVAVPPQVEKAAGPASPPDWVPLFSAAGLDLSQWPPAQPMWTPPVDSDARAAWTGSLAERRDIRMRIEAAAYRGKPVYFELIGPWTRPQRMQPYQMTTGERAFFAIGIVLWVSLLVVGAMLARRNLRLGRGDRRGAFRLAAFAFATWAVAWSFGVHHVPNFGELALFNEFVAWGLLWSGSLWVLYIAMEPFVRRRWPATLISWSRLLAGGFRDPLVGRDVLVGCLFGSIYGSSWKSRLVRSVVARPCSATALFGSTGAVSGRTHNNFRYIDQLRPGAFYPSCDSVCSVPFPGFAAQGVGGSGRIRSSVHSLFRSEQPVRSRGLGGILSLLGFDCVSADPVRLAGFSGLDVLRQCPVLVSADDAWVCLVFRHQSGRDPADGRAGVLWLLHLSGGPTRFRRCSAGGVSFAVGAPHLRRGIQLMLQGFPTWRMTGYPEVIHLDEKPATRK